MMTRLTSRLYLSLVVIYGLGAVGAWAWMSARIQQANADQLVDGFLFENASTFSGAVFPASHTQLVKWPLFAALRWFQFSPAAYQALTVALAIVTIVGFAYLLYRLESRPLRFGALCLGLGSVLMLTPAQVYAGVTSPFNLAMLTGRNIEYLLYLGVLIFCLEAPALKNWRLLAATAVLSLLMASDHLFVMLSLGGAAIYWVIAWVIKHPRLQLSANGWLATSAASWLLAGLLQAITGHYTHVVNDALPYGTIKTLPQLWQSLAGTVQALGLNVGLARPNELLTLVPLAFNAAVALVLVWAVGGLLRRLYCIAAQPQSGAQPLASPSRATSLAVMLLATTLAATIAFAAVNQPYLSNARYLSISLFAAFVTLAVYQRGLHLTARPLLIAGSLGALSLAAGLASTWHHTTALVRSPLQQRNQQIVRIISHHPVQQVVGNYWRVIPIRAMSPGARQAVVPLDGCLRPTRLLGSSAWQPDLRTQSFVYIVSLQPNEVPGTQCTQQIVTANYGQPSSTQILSHNAAGPAEELLFYDAGATYSRL